MSNIYETKRLLDEYLLFHYGSDQEVMPWTFGPKEALGFAIRTVQDLLDSAADKGTALDLGCAVGRSSFELAARGYEVCGIDYSHSFIEAAQRLQAGEALAYDRLDEGSQHTPLMAKAVSGRVTFEQGDAMNLRADLGSYDVLHAANLLCRLTEPQRLIERLPALVKPGGQLLLTTPCTWLADFTPPKNWPQGSTRDWLRERLSEHFTQELERDVPFLIREHARKYQWSVAWGTRWRRKA
jgi:putative 4-mercaptohistidine N1-methyltranferase